MHSYIIVSDQEITNSQFINLISDFVIGAATINNLENHPDIINIYPQAQTKTNLSNVSIKIEQIRKLQSQLTKTPLKLPVQMAIIWQAETLTLAASNAFLKLLEEPGEYSKIFLITQQLSKLLPTIQSRCQIINFLPKQPQSPDLKALYLIYDEFNQAELFTRLTLVQKYHSDRNEALSFLKNLLIIMQNNLPKENDNKDISLKIRQTETAYNDIMSNVNLKLALDNLAITWGKFSEKLD